MTNNYGRLVIVDENTDYPYLGIFHEYTHIDTGGTGYAEAAIIEFSHGRIKAVLFGDFCFSDGQFEQAMGENSEKLDAIKIKEG